MKDQPSAAMRSLPWEAGLQGVRGFETVVLEQAGDVVDRKIQQSGQPADRDMASIDRESENFGERPRKRRWSWALTRWRYAGGG